MLMPKASVNEDDLLSTNKSQVGFSGKFFSVQSIAETERPADPTYLSFGGGVF